MGLWDRFDNAWTMMVRGSHKYSALPGRIPVAEAQEKLTFWAQNHRKVLKFCMAIMAAMVFWYLFAATFRVATAISNTSCDDVQAGYTCSPEISHHWGQYSPFFSVPQDSAPSNAIPDGCIVTFVQSLYRHGARDPTASKTKVYNATIQQIQANATSYGAGYEFLKDFEYTLGADQLTTFGQQQLVNGGRALYARYEDFARKNSPFVRSASEDRVVESARNWTQGFHAAAVTDEYPYDIVVISEADGSNNTLNHGLCTAFEEGPDSEISGNAQAIWRDVFTRDIMERLNMNLPGANLSAAETIYMMDLCPFTTVADTQGAISEFCSLFTVDEWKSYDYYQTLGKFYGFGAGNPLGPTQGVGFTNELIARLTGQPVADKTSTNRTLDSSSDTFPLGRSLFADFSHDNDMTGIFYAMGLYSGTKQLSNTTREDDPVKLGGYSAAWTVPFAARMFVEKMVCPGVAGGEELVRVLVNDRVQPLETCGADSLGRCTLSEFVESLSFAKEGGHWDSCFV
ncbi:unnamed protein product [Discula destructiva]